MHSQKTVPFFPITAPGKQTSKPRNSVKQWNNHGQRIHLYRDMGKSLPVFDHPSCYKPIYKNKTKQPTICHKRAAAYVSKCKRTAFLQAVGDFD